MSKENYGWGYHMWYNRLINWGRVNGLSLRVKKTTDKVVIYYQDGEFIQPVEWWSISERRFGGFA